MLIAKRILQGLLSLFVIFGLSITKNISHIKPANSLRDKLLGQERKISIGNKWPFILTLGMASCESPTGPSNSGHGSHSSHSSHSSHRSSMS